MLVSPHFPSRTCLRLLCGGLLGMIGAVLKAQPLEMPMPEDLLPELHGYLETALKQSPAMLVKNIDIEKAEANRINAESGLWFHVNGSVQANVVEQRLSQATGAYSRTTGIFYNLGVAQPVFHWGELKNRAEIGRIGLHITEKNFGVAYRDLAANIRRQYLNLIVLKSHLVYYQAHLRQIEKNFGLTETDFKEGRMAQTDFDNARLNLEEARLAVERKMADYDQAKRTFRRIVGLEELREETIPAQLPKPVYSTGATAHLLDNFLHQGAATTFEARVIKDIIHQEELNYRIAKYQLYPKLDMIAGIAQSGQNTVGAGTVNQVGVVTKTYGLAVNWSIFDGFATRAAKLSALANKRAYERNLKDYFATVTEQAISLRKSVDFSARAMAIAETRREQAETASVRAQEDLKRGLGSQAGVDAAQIGLYASENSAIASRAEFLSDWSDFVSTVFADPALKLLPPGYLK